MRLSWQHSVQTDFWHFERRTRDFASISIALFSAAAAQSRYGLECFRLGLCKLWEDSSTRKLPILPRQALIRGNWMMTETSAIIYRLLQMQQLQSRTNAIGWAVNWLTSCVNQRTFIALHALFSSECMSWGLVVLFSWGLAGNFIQTVKWSVGGSGYLWHLLTIPSRSQQLSDRKVINYFTLTPD